QQELRLVIAGDAGEGLRLPWAAGLAAAAQVVEAQDAIAMGIERPVGPGDIRPPAPALTRLLAEANAPGRGDAAERADDRGAGRSDHAPGEADAAQTTAVIKSRLAGDLQHPFAHDWIGGGEHGRTNPRRDQDRLDNG